MISVLKEILILNYPSINTESKLSTRTITISCFSIQLINRHKLWKKISINIFQSSEWALKSNLCNMTCEALKIQDMRIDVIKQSTPSLIFLVMVSLKTCAHINLNPTLKICWKSFLHCWEMSQCVQYRDNKEQWIFSTQENNRREEKQCADSIFYIISAGFQYLNKTVLVLAWPPMHFGVHPVDLKAVLCTRRSENLSQTIEPCNLFTEFSYQAWAVSLTWNTSIAYLRAKRVCLILAILYKKRAQKYF